jgi:hypothetical protein
MHPMALVEVYIGAGAALLARSHTQGFNFSVDDFWRKFVQEFKDSAPVPALVSTKVQLAVDGSTTPIGRSTIFANGH